MRGGGTEHDTLRAKCLSGVKTCRRVRWTSQKQIKYPNNHQNLLDVVAVTSGATANDTLSTVFAPAPVGFGDTDGSLSSQLVSMNTGEMTTEIVLPAKGPATVSVRASVGFQPVRVMSGHVSFEVKRSGKSTSAFRALVFPARIRFVILESRRH